MHEKIFFNILLCVCIVASVMSDSVQPHGLYPTRLLCPRTPPGKSPGAGCHALLQGTFPTEGPNPCLLQLLHCRQNLYHGIIREALCLSLNSFEVQTYFSFFFSVENGVSGIGSSVKGNAEQLPEKYLDLDFKYP